MDADDTDADYTTRLADLTEGEVIDHYHVTAKGGGVIFTPSLFHGADAWPKPSAASLERAGEIFRGELLTSEDG